MKNNTYRQKLYSVEEIKELINVIADNDDLVLYTPEDIQRIFSLESIEGARRLMNTPGFPLMRIGRNLRVTKGELKRFIKQNKNTKINLI